VVRTQIQLPESQAEALKALALRDHLSMAELIRVALERQLRAAPGPGPRERVERALAVCGRFASGRTDISGDHDAALADAFAERA
jgi:hypothetical protein